MPRGRFGRQSAGDRTLAGPSGGATVGRLHTLHERPAMMSHLTVFVPAVIAIYTATGAWVFSCDPISKTVDIVRGGLLYGWIGVLFMCARVGATMPGGESVPKIR